MIAERVGMVPGARDEMLAAGDRIAERAVPVVTSADGIAGCLDVGSVVAPAVRVRPHASGSAWT